MCRCWLSQQFKLKVFSEMSRVEHNFDKLVSALQPTRHAEEGGMETSLAHGFDTKINIWVYEYLQQNSCCMTA